LISQVQWNSKCRNEKKASRRSIRHSDTQRCRSLVHAHIGCGLGNCFYTYFHAVVLAERFEDCNCAAVARPQVGSLLRGESSKRIYWGCLSRTREILMDFATLNACCAAIESQDDRNRRSGRTQLIYRMPQFRRGTEVDVPWTSSLSRADPEAPIRIIRDPLPVAHCWGRSIVAVHVRLSDFAKVDDKSSQRLRPRPTDRQTRAYQSHGMSMSCAHSGDGIQTGPCFYSQMESRRVETDAGHSSTYIDQAQISLICCRCRCINFCWIKLQLLTLGSVSGNMPSIWLAGPPEDDTFADESCATAIFQPYACLLTRPK